MRSIFANTVLIGSSVLSLCALPSRTSAQTFGMVGTQKKVTLDRKMPASGHIEGSTFRVVVETTGAIGSYSTDPKVTEQTLTSAGSKPSKTSRPTSAHPSASTSASTPASISSDKKTPAATPNLTISPQVLATDLKNSIEALIIHSQSSLSVNDLHPDTVILCRIVTYDQPPPRATVQLTGTQAIAGAAQGKQAAKEASKAVPLQRYTGLLTVNFKAIATKTAGSVAADTVTAKFDEEFSASGAEKGVMHSASNTWHHLTKGGSSDDTPPTPAELRDLLMKDSASQIAAHFVTTSETIQVLIAHGKSLDPAANMEMAKLWPRAIDSLTRAEPFKKPEDDAYRDYDLGVAYEALAYESKDLNEALENLTTASTFYGKAIDAKPLEKNFMFPEQRIETSIAYYKKLIAIPSAQAPAKKIAPADIMTNEQIVALVAGGLDTENIIDTIKNAPAVNFDLSPSGLIALTKGGVKGPIIIAMKARARKTA